MTCNKTKEKFVTLYNQFDGCPVVNFNKDSHQHQNDISLMCKVNVSEIIMRRGDT